MSPSISVLLGKLPAHGLSKSTVSDSALTRSTAQKPATPRPHTNRTICRMLRTMPPSEDNRPAHHTSRPRHLDDFNSLHSIAIATIFLYRLDMIPHHAVESIMSHHQHDRLHQEGKKSQMTSFRIQELKSV
jgi:hypothetical protein